MGDPYRQAPVLEDDGFPVRIEIKLDNREFLLAMLDLARKDFPDVDWNDANIQVSVGLNTDGEVSVESVHIVKEIQKEKIKT